MSFAVCARSRRENMIEFHDFMLIESILRTYTCLSRSICVSRTPHMLTNEVFCRLCFLLNNVQRYIETDNGALGVFILIVCMFMQPKSNVHPHRRFGVVHIAVHRLVRVPSSHIARTPHPFHINIRNTRRTSKRNRQVYAMLMVTYLFIVSFLFGFL